MNNGVGVYKENDSLLFLARTMTEPITFNIENIFCDPIRRMQSF